MRTGKHLQKQDVTDFVSQIMSKEDGEQLMTVAEQYFQDGKQEGILQGMQEGVEIARQDVAKNMLVKGMSFDVVSELTGLPLSEVESLEIVEE
ncbi:MAG: hypothetical protein ACE365_00735 [Gammaproteobacteria bacterium]